MTTPVSIPELERPAFFDGQRLEADDLAVMYDFHRELRWLHNRALHNWGIAVGLAVSGKKGSREVTVAPGYALDCQGHDLLLSRPVTIPVPAVAGTASGKPMLYYLTASYADDASLPSSESRDGECEGGGAVRRAEAPLVRWQDPRSVVTENRWRRGLDIVLAAAQVLDCALVAAPSAAERRSARPEPQPFVAAGTSAPETTVWTFFTGTSGIAGIQAAVDTSSAGFQRTPTYTAQIAGTRVLKADTGSGAPNGILVDGFGSVVSATSSGFVYRLVMPRNLVSGPYTLNPDAIFVAKTLDTLRTALKWSVAWMGVEG